VSNPRRIPLFPLGTVLLPESVLPLHIFEPRYRQLVQDLVDRPEHEQAFGVIAIRQGHEVGDDGVRALYEVGCLAQVRGIQPYPDGRFDIVTVGTTRFTLTGLNVDEPYLTGDVIDLPDEIGEHPGAVGGIVRGRFEQYREIVQMEDEPSELPDDPTSLAWTVAAGMLLDLDERQRILAADDTTSRLRVERELLHRELGILQNLPSLPAFDMSRLPMSAN
jgi:Lon protease-like protein